MPVRLLGLLFVSSILLVACGEPAGREARKAAEAERVPPQQATITFAGNAFDMEPATLEAAPVTITFRNNGREPISAFVGQFLPGKGIKDLTKVERDVDFLSHILPSGITPETAPGEKSHITISFPPGSYAVVGQPDDQPATFEVVAATKEIAAPTADLQVVAGDFFFKLSETKFPSGPLTIELSNEGIQGHEMLVTKVASKDVGGAYSVAPAPGGKLWLRARLSSGRYQFICFFPDPTSGKSHDKLGMKAELRVS